MSTRTPRSGALAPNQAPDCPGETQLPEIHLGGHELLIHTEAFATQKADQNFLDQFNQIFTQEKNPDWLNWKYAEGRGSATQLLEHSGEIVANWSGFPRLLSWKGTSKLAVQNGDVFVAQKFRGILTRHGPLYYVSSSFLRHNVGNYRKFAVAYGFPNLRHMRLLNRLCLFDELFEMVLLKWRCKPQKRKWGAYLAEIQVQPSDTWLEARCLALHRSMPNAILTQRSAKYLRWRYWNHPNYRYIFIKARPNFGAEPSLLVMRKIENELHLTDFIGPAQHLPKIIHLLASDLLSGATEFLTTWASPVLAATLPQSDLSTATGAHFAYATCSIPQCDSAMKSEWWLLSGDTDFM